MANFPASTEKRDGTRSGGRSPLLHLGRAILIVLLAFTANSSSAEEWMFRRSYYSHEMPEEARREYPAPRLYSAYRPAIAGDGFGFAVRSGYRFNRTYLQSGNSGDYTIQHEGWFSFQP